MKTMLLLLGMAAILMGLLWIGQGAGIIQWPASSFMLDQRPWAIRGTILGAIGIGLILLDLQRDEMRRLGFTRDYREGVAAFLEKRAATFEGR